MSRNKIMLAGPAELEFPRRPNVNAIPALLHPEDVLVLLETAAPDAPQDTFHGGAGHVDDGM